MEKTRCPWCASHPIYIEYHDREWGVPVHDDRLLFEHIVLDGAQAGLSWLTILKKRENYRKAFHNFDAERVARYGARDTARLLADEGIVRNKQKIASAIANAKAFLKIREEFGTFDTYIWSFVNGRTIVNRPLSLKDIAPTSKESDAMSRDLKQRGFSFVGSTICYAFMQASGLVNDHLVDCFRHAPLSKPTRR